VFARDGCLKLALGDLSIEGLEETKKIIQSKYPAADVTVTKVDISDEEDVQEFHDEAIRSFGRIDFAANVAGYAHAANKIVSIDSKMYDLSYRVNQRGVGLLELLGAPDQMLTFGRPSFVIEPS
jgi:NAD(P)-dependent dehydrogenase (short-subunit alcohol dehydrogenase family)